MDITISGIAVVQQRLVPVGLRQTQHFLPQLIGDLSSVVVLADGVGPGAEDPVDRMLLVLLLLMHHGPVLPAGQTAVLGRHAAAVLGFVPAAGEKIPFTILTDAGGVAVVKAVHQVEAVKLYDAAKAHPLDEYHLFLLAGIPRKDICGLHHGSCGERLDIRQREAVHHPPEVIAGEAVVGGDGKESLVPLLEPAQVFSFKVISSHREMVYPKWDGKRGGQVAEEKLPIRSLGIHQAVHHTLAEKLVQDLLLSGSIQKAIGRVCPQHIQQSGDIRPHLRKEPGKAVPVRSHQRLGLIADIAAELDQGLQGRLLLIEDLGGKVSGGIFYLGLRRTLRGFFAMTLSKKWTISQKLALFGMMKAKLFQEGQTMPPERNDNDCHCNGICA